MGCVKLIYLLTQTEMVRLFTLFLKKQNIYKIKTIIINNVFNSTHT